MGFGFVGDARFTRTEDEDEIADRKARSKGVCLIGGSKPPTAKKFAKLVGPISDLFIHNAWRLVYCGMGTGIAGAVAKRVLERGGRVKAILVEGAEPPDCPTEDRVVVKNFHQRRKKLFDSPFAFLVIPGGSGTTAELTDLVAWRGAGLLTKTVVVYDPTNWFAPLIKMYDRALEAGAIRQGFAETVTLTKRLEEAERAFEEGIGGHELPPVFG